MKAIVQVFSFDVIAKVISGAISILLIRYMSEGEYARYLVALSLVAVATGTLAASFNRIYVVGFERLKLAKMTSSFLGLQLLIIAALALVGVLFLQSFKDVYWFIVFLVIATCLAEYARTVFQQQLAFLRYSLVETARTLVFAAGIALLVWLASTSLAAWEVLLLQASVMTFVFVVMFGKRIDWGELFHFKDSLELVRSVVKGQYRYLFAYFFVLAFFSQVDVFMLQMIGTTKQLASYGSAFRYYTIIVLVLNSIHTVLLPLVQRLQSLDDLDKLYSKHVKMLLLIIPLIIIVAIASQWLIPIVDKGKYPDAVPAFRILCISAILSIALSPHVNLIMRFEDFRYLFLLILGGLVLNAVLNLIFIPAWGAPGTSLATLIAYGYINGSIYFRARGYRRQLDLLVESHP